MGAPDDTAAAGFAPGRTCPLHYRYRPEAFRRPPELAADVLLVAGGVYGNPQALDALEERAARETLATRIVLNGDFNWFDVAPDTFAAINARALTHAAIRGNVETELAAEDDAGCGCGYPEWVADGDVARSNRIMTRLRDAARAHPTLVARLAALPMHLVAAVGDVRIAIVHGDAWSLAGWEFTQERLAERMPRLHAAWRAADVDVFASSHTCLPVAFDDVVDGRRRALLNNGATGMPNFAGTTFGLATRIALAPAQDALYRLRLGAVVLEAIPIRYDHAAWLRRFAADWAPDSPAAESYGRRIADGPAYHLESAVRGTFARTA
jgi:predicted phosphodiesterase